MLSENAKLYARLVGAHEKTQALGRRRMAAIVDASDDAIIGEDASGVIASWNARAACANLRPLLHDEGTRHRTRAVHQPADRPGTRRTIRVESTAGYGARFVLGLPTEAAIRERG